MSGTFLTGFYHVSTAATVCNSIDRQEYTDLDGEG